MAKFCAFVDINIVGKRSTDFEEILANGHRGYISLSEDDIAKEFDKMVGLLGNKFAKVRAEEDQRKNNKWYRQSDEFVLLTLWNDEAISIADEIFEDQFLK